jgi:hypothetical protein
MCNILGKMKGITPEKQTNWWKGWCDTNKISSSFYNKKEGYNKEWFEEDNNKIKKNSSSAKTRITSDE